MFRLFRKSPPLPSAVQNEEAAAAESVNAPVCARAILGLLEPYRFPPTEEIYDPNAAPAFVEFVEELYGATKEQVIYLRTATGGKIRGGADWSAPNDRIVTVTRCCAFHAQLDPCVPAAFTITTPRRPDRDFTDVERIDRQEAFAKILTVWAAEPSIVGVHFGRSLEPILPISTPARSRGAQ